MRRATAIVSIGITAGIGIGIASAQVSYQKSDPPKGRETPQTVSPAPQADTKPTPVAEAPASPTPAPRSRADQQGAKQPSSAAPDAPQEQSLQYVNAKTTPNPALEQAILDYLSPELPCGTRETQVRYLHNEVDLNGDGLDEAIAYLVGPLTCGTGGCTTLVYEPTEAGYEMVSYLTLVNYPIVVSDETTQGWHDLVLTVEGGGAQPGYRRLKFNGTSYPSNPSTQPFVAEDELSGKVFVVEAASSYESAAKLTAPQCQQ